MSTPYPKEPISPLRSRMIDDMRVRNFSPATQRDYIRGVKLLAAYLGRSPDTATAEEVRAFQRHLGATGTTPAVQKWMGGLGPSRSRRRGSWVGGVSEPASGDVRC